MSIESRIGDRTVQHGETSYILLPSNWPDYCFATAMTHSYQLTRMLPHQDGSRCKFCSQFDTIYIAYLWKIGYCNIVTPLLFLQQSKQNFKELEFVVWQRFEEKNLNVGCSFCPGGWAAIGLAWYLHLLVVYRRWESNVYLGHGGPVDFPNPTTWQCPVSQMVSILNAKTGSPKDYLVFWFSIEPCGLLSDQSEDSDSLFLSSVGWKS